MRRSHFKALICLVAVACDGIIGEVTEPAPSNDAGLALDAGAPGGGSAGGSVSGSGGGTVSGTGGGTVSGTGGGTVSGTGGGTVSGTGGGTVSGTGGGSVSGSGGGSVSGSGGGSVSGSGGGSATSGPLTLQKIEWGQSVFQTNPRLVAGKPALLRVHLIASQANVTGVTVVARGAMGTLTLMGPAAPPLSEVPSDLTQQWTVEVPGAWVTAGLQLVVDVNSGAIVRTLAPTVGVGKMLELTSVPIIHQSVQGNVLNLETPVVAIWPLKGINNQTRAPYTFGGTLTPTDTNAWGNLLVELYQLRSTDNSNRTYYGFVRPGFGSGIGGVAFIGGGVGVGRDDHLGVALHELGHAFGRDHAPCPTSLPSDPLYPYPNGSIGSWGWNAVQRQLMNPASYADVMSYCQPQWVSDHNYRAVQTALETQAYVLGEGELQPQLLISGRLDGEEVSLRPVHRVRTTTRSEAADSGKVLRVHFANGSVRSAGLQTLRLADVGSDARYFSALVEDLGPVTRVEVLVHGQLVHTRSAEPAQPTTATALRANGRVRVEWTPADASLAVAVVQGDRRTTLAFHLVGGRAELPLTVDGALELSVSTGLNAAIHRSP